MAARFRNNISRYVGGNHFSPSFSQFSAARPSIGARFCSSSSMPPSPAQATRREITPVPATLAAVLLYSFCEWIDLMDWRSSYKTKIAEIVRKKKPRLEDDLMMVQRKIETVKSKHFERPDKNANVPE